eukprot:GHRQ01021177.1.p1 GENE.GHRQ01021177.1~~GHRQ01021177.1.p1  ORF type:complete len:160 (-),score=13.52 GHRQ01021177.1:117-596(-)
MMAVRALPEVGAQYTRLLPAAPHSNAAACHAYSCVRPLLAKAASTGLGKPQRDNSSSLCCCVLSCSAIIKKKSVWSQLPHGATARQSNHACVRANFLVTNSAAAAVVAVLRRLPQLHTFTLKHMQNKTKRPAYCHYVTDRFLPHASAALLFGGMQPADC